MSEDVAKKTLFCLNMKNKGSGLDTIPEKFLKEAAGMLANPLPRIINLSLKLTAFPEECKIAKLKRLFKKSSKIHLKICRPILLLPLVSKVIEKSIHYRLLYKTGQVLGQNFLLIHDWRI